MELEWALEPLPWTQENEFLSYNQPTKLLHYSWGRARWLVKACAASASCFSAFRATGWNNAWAWRRWGAEWGGGRWRCCRRIWWTTGSWTGKDRVVVVVVEVVGVAGVGVALWGWVEWRFGGLEGLMGVMKVRGMLRLEK